MPELNENEWKVIVKVLIHSTVQDLIGAEEWNLTEEEETLLWAIINKVSV